MNKVQSMNEQQNTDVYCTYIDAEWKITAQNETSVNRMLQRNADGM